MAIIQSGATTDTLTVDATSKAARATLYDATGNVAIVADKTNRASSAISGVPISGMNDNNVMNVRTDKWGNIGTTAITPLFWEQYEGTVINVQRWLNANTTFAPAQTGVGLSLNPTLLTNVNAVSVAISKKRFIRTGRGPIQYKSRARLTNYANSVNEIGLADGVTGTTQIANGAYFQMTAAGNIQGVVTTLSVDNAVPLTFNPAYSVTNIYSWDILIDDDGVTFMVQDTATGAIVAKNSYNLTLNGGRLFAATHLAAFNRCYNTAVLPATAPTHISHFVFVGMVDSIMNKSFATLSAGNGFGSGVGPITGTQTLQFANSAVAANATLSNTAAAYTTLGGLFSIAAPAGAATDYCLFGFQVPAPYTLNITGVSISLWNTGAASATTPTTLVWFVASQSTAVSLATGGSQYRRPLGVQSIPVGAAIGTPATDVNRKFDSPLVTDGGQFVVIGVRIPVGTATASQVLSGSVDIDGYFE